MYYHSFFVHVIRITCSGPEAPAAQIYSEEAGACASRNEICSAAAAPCSAISTLQGCQDACASDSRCLSLEYNEGTGACQLSTSCKTALNSDKTSTTWKLYVKQAPPYARTGTGRYFVPQAGQTTASPTTRMMIGTKIDHDCEDINQCSCDHMPDSVWFQSPGVHVQLSPMSK